MEKRQLYDNVKTVFCHRRQVCLVAAMSEVFDDLHPHPGLHRHAPTDSPGSLPVGKLNPLPQRSPAAP
jgi:hypothetical protein